MTGPHDTYLKRAIELAVRARDGGNGPFGALLVSADGVVLGEAENQVQAEQDFTAHAEMVLLREVARKHGLDSLRDTTLYASGEPCALCAGAILYVGIRRLVYGLALARQGQLRRRQPSLRRQVPCRDILALGSDPVEVIGPLHESAAEAPFRCSDAESALRADSQGRPGSEDEQR